MRNERGSAMVVAMLLLLLAGTVTAVLLERGRGLEAATKHDREDLRAFYAAEGGLAKARHELARDPYYTGETLRVGEREVTVEIEGWSVVVRTEGCRIDAKLAPAPLLPRIVAWQAR